MRRLWRIVLAGALVGTASAADGGTLWLPSLWMDADIGFESPRVQSAEAGLRLLAERRIGGLRLSASAVLAGDARDLLEPGRPDDRHRAAASRRVLIGTQAEFELREAYADLRLGDWSLRAGKQQIVWGSADGIKLLDVLNPQTFREFITEEQSESRIPLWALQGSRYFGSRLRFDAVIQPDLSFHDIPEPGALFEITSPTLTPQGSVSSGFGVLALRSLQSLLQGDDGRAAFAVAALERLAPLLEQVDGLAGTAPTIQVDRPALGLSTVELGLRLGWRFGALDAQWMWLRHFGDTPLVQARIEPAGISITKRYVQTQTWGLALSRPFAASLLRFEGYYTQHSVLPAVDFDGDGLRATAPGYGGLIGVDLPFRDAGLLSFQLGSLRQVRRPDRYEAPDPQTYGSALWRDELAGGRLSVEAFALLSLSDGSAYARPRLRWPVGAALECYAGADLFFGADSSVFGQFDRRDRLVAGLVWRRSL